MSLQNNELVLLNRLGERIQNALTSVINGFPQHAKSIAGLSAFLQYNRSNSQRILNAYRCKSGSDVLLHLPGYSGCVDFAEKVQKHVSSSEHEELLKVTELFLQAINEYAKSHAELKRKLSTKPIPKKNELTRHDKRASFFLSAKTLLNTQIETLFCCYVLKPNEYNSEYLHEFALISKLGISRSAESPPFVQFYTHDKPEHFKSPELLTKESRLKDGQFHIGIAKEYSTEGLESHYSSYAQSNSGIIFEDIVDTQFDATFVFSNPDQLRNPLNTTSCFSSTSISIKTPTKKLIMFVMVDKAIDRRSSVNVGCYMSNYKVKEASLRASELWTERLPDFPELSIVDLNSPEREKVSGIDAKEMIDYLLDYGSLDLERFTPYLIEIDYPIWSSTYRIYFEHE